MICSFTLTHEGTTHELMAEQVSVNEQTETLRVYSKYDPNTFITLSNNRPSLHAQHLYHIRYKWTAGEGDHSYKRMVGLITNYLEYYIRGLWKPGKKVRQKPVPPINTQGRLF